MSIANNSEKFQATDIQLLNVRKAAAFLGVNVSTMRRWAKQGKLPAVKVGTRGDWRFRKEELQKLLTPVPAVAKADTQPVKQERE